MAEPPTGRNGGAALGPSVPTGLVVASMAVAVVAVSGLLFLLYTRTTGPGEVLRDFLERVEAGDCHSSYEMLDASVRIDPQTWCDGLAVLAEQVDSQFAVQRVVLEGEIALVRVRNPDGTRAVWRLRRVDRSWRVLDPLTGVQFVV